MAYTDLDADPVNLFLIEGIEFAGVITDLFVDDLEQAKEELPSHGCKIIRWHGKDQDCSFQDPFGLIFNLWERTQ